MSSPPRRDLPPQRTHLFVDEHVALNRSLTPLSYIASPVPDFASTLLPSGTSDNGSDHEDDNLRFLRTTDSAEHDPIDRALARRNGHTSHVALPTSVQYHGGDSIRYDEHEALLQDEPPSFLPSPHAYQMSDHDRRGAASRFTADSEAGRQQPSMSTVIDRHLRGPASPDRSRATQVSTRLHSPHRRLPTLPSLANYYGHDSPIRVPRADDRDLTDSQYQDRMMHVLSRLSRLDDGHDDTVNTDAANHDNTSGDRNSQQPLDASAALRSVDGTVDHERERRDRSQNVDQQLGTLHPDDEDAELHQMLQYLRQSNPSLEPRVAREAATRRLQQSHQQQEQRRAVTRRMHEADDRQSNPRWAGRGRDETLPEMHIGPELSDAQAAQFRRLEALEQRSENLRSAVIMQHARNTDSNARMLRYVRERDQIVPPTSSTPPAGDREDDGPHNDGSNSTEPSDAQAAQLRRREALEQRSEDLRSAAIMQHARTTNSNARMLRYMREREQIVPPTSTPPAGDREDDGPHNDGSNSTSPYRSYSRWARTMREQLEASGNTSLSQIEALRDANQPPWARYWDRHSSQLLRRLQTDASTSKHSMLKISPFLENAVKYLDRLRSCSNYDEALFAAIETGFGTKEFFADKHDDFIMDVAAGFSAPSPSSWLTPGIRFEGSQRTTDQIDTTNIAPGTISPRHASSTSNMPRHASYSQAHLDPLSSQPQQSSLGHWPVKVNLHVVDFNDLTLSGTMEAYDIPKPYDQSSTSGESSGAPVTTYLEGQIIDLARHSFLTPTSKPTRSAPTSANATSLGLDIPNVHAADATSKIDFPATTAQTDASNWRRLPPFSEMKDDDEVARALLSSGRIEAILRDYIFMRWKERCFINDKGSTSCSSSAATSRSSPPQGTTDRHDDASQSRPWLTINGFYYACLDRATGVVEALYHDPASSRATPFQRLKLKGTNAGCVGSWEFC